jgi:hypothetical protein
MASKRIVAATIGAVCAIAAYTGVVSAAETDQMKTTRGVTAYLGVVPAP